MKSLVYLSLLKAKNKVLEMLRTPSQLVLLLLFALIIAFSFFGPKSQQSGSGHRDIQELYALIFALYSFAFVMTAKKGFHNGASMFSMADINLLFTAPFKSTSLLGYGLAQQLTRCIMLGVVILYQSETLNKLYGIGALPLLFIFVGYAVTTFLSQMTAMLIYCFTSSDDKKRNLLKGVCCFVLCVFVGAAVFLAYNQDGVSAASLSQVVNEKLFLLFPVSGIVKMGVVSAIEKQHTYTLLSAVCVCVLVAVYYLVICKIKADYYEDVLCAAETSFSAVTASKEGRAAEDAPRNVKVGKMGFTKGVGASAVYYKHKIENRRGKVFMLNITSVAFIAVSALYSYFVKDTPVGVFVLNAYLLVFSVASSRWSKELTYPYIYLIPESAAKKLFHLLRADFPTLALESVLCFLPVYFFAKLTLPVYVSMVAARISLGILITGVNFIMQRFVGTSEKKVLIFSMYFLLISVFVLPATVLAVVIGMALPFNTQFAYFVFTAVNLLVSTVIFWCTRNVLEYAEYNNR